MDRETRLPVGTVVTAEVVAHHPWGVGVRLVSPAAGARGVIDVMYVTNERPYQPPDDYPEIGRQLVAVVMPYPPNGQLRLSTRDTNLDPVHGE